MKTLGLVVACLMLAVFLVIGGSIVAGHMRKPKKEKVDE